MQLPELFFTVVDRFPRRVTIQLLGAIALLFVLSRVFIYTHPPLYYSDVKADYERYANMWRYGLTPYREHLYEYPPATIPLLAMPLNLDQAGVGKYYPNYRAQILIIDVVFFAVMVATLVKRKVSGRVLLRNAVAYIVLTVLGKDFFYEGIDLAFIGTFLTAILTVWWFKPYSYLQQLAMWTLFWLSAAIKFLTLPLLVPLWLATRKQSWQDYVAPIAGFFLVWGVPLLLYGSSLQVSFIFNNARPIKYASLPAHVIEWVDVFTDSETRVDKAPDFPTVGPVSTQVTKIVKVGFPVAMLGFLAWALLEIGRAKKRKVSLQPLMMVREAWAEFVTPKALETEVLYTLLLKIYAVFIFVLFLTAKIFSQPFHIWYMPLIMLFPWKKTWQWGVVFGCMLLMILLDMTPWLSVPREWVIGGVVPVSMIRNSFRFLPMLVVLWVVLRTAVGKVKVKKKLG